MKRETLWTIGGGVAVLAVVLPVLSIVSRGTDWRVVQLYGGATSAQCLKEPQAVDAFVLDPNSGVAGAPERAPVPGHVTVIGRYASAQRTTDTVPQTVPQTVPHTTADAATAAELSLILRDDNTYDWMRAKSNAFRPTLGLRFVRDASRLEVAICFESDMIVAYRMGRFVGVEDIDAARPKLVAIAKRLFPGDPRFANLRDAR